MALQNDDDLCLTTDKSRRKLDRLNVKLPFLQAELSGNHILIALVILCSAMPGIGAMYYHHVEGEKVIINMLAQRNAQGAANTQRLIKLEQFVERAEANNEAVIYVLTLSQADREKLQLSKPAKIRELERGR